MYLGKCLAAVAEGDVDPAIADHPADARRQTADTVPMMSTTPADDDPLAAFELPPDLMGTTYEHAISDAADVTHERGHAVAAALQRALKGSTVEYAFPGMVTVHMKSGAMARCGGPAIGWLVDVERKPGADPLTLEVSVPDDETDPVRVAEILAKALRKY